MASYSVNWSAVLSSVSGAVSVGHCLVQNSAGTLLVGTTANRASYGRCVGIAETAGDGDSNTPTVRMIETGIVPASITGLAAGTVSWVRVSSTGALERVTPGVGDDIVGKAHADGSVQFHPGVWDSTNYAGGGGGGSGATLPIVLTTDVSGILPAANGGTGSATLPAGGLAGLTALAAGDAASVATAAADATTKANAAQAAAIAASQPLDADLTAIASAGLGTGVATFLGTPSGANLATALTSALPDTKGGTGLTSLGSGVATFLGTPSSSNLATAVTGETGTGGLVFDTSPIFKTRISLNNPADTFKFNLVSSAIVADRNLNLPLLTATDTLVSEAFIQTLTNKTIAGASNTLTVRIANDVTGLGTGVATFLATPSGANLASALTSALPDTKGGTGITSLGSGVATALGTFSSANIKAACTDETGSGGALVFATGPVISAPELSSTPTLSGASCSTTNNAKGTAVDVNPVNVQTTDATVTTLDSFTIASNSAVVVSWLVTAIKSDSSQAAAYSCSACFVNTAGTVGQVGTTTTTVIGESDSAWDCTADNSTTTIRLRITGKAATTIQWAAVLTRLTVIP